MNKAQARLVLGTIAVVGALELVASAHVYRDRIADEDWANARTAVEALPAGDGYALATGWLGPRARMEVPRLASESTVGRADLHGIAALHVLGLGDAWSQELSADLEGIPRPEPVGSQDIGPFTLTSYALPGRGVLADWGTPGSKLGVATDGGKCRGSGPYRCAEGNVAHAVAEIDYRPRACLTFAIADGVPARARQAQMPLGAELRGHVGFADYNDRLRNDAPARVVIRVDDRVVARFVATDEQGWRAFAIPTAGSVGDVEVEVTVGVLGTWGKTGLRRGKARRVCLELRSLEGAE